MNKLNLSKSTVAAVLLFACANMSAHAISIADAYVGSNDHGIGDVIGDVNKFDIMGMDISVAGSTLTVTINTNFAGLGDNGLFAGITAGNTGIGYGDLLLSSAWNPNGSAPYLNDNASTGTVWEYAFSLDNRWMPEGSGTGTLFALNGVDNSEAILSDSFLTGGTFRDGQEVAVSIPTVQIGVSSNLTAVNNTGSWAVDAVNKTVSFEIDLTNTGLAGSGIAVHWGMTCANDVIEGFAPAVPVPAAVWLFGSGLIGLVAVARRRAA
jgi:hypothetical protein